MENPQRSKSEPVRVKILLVGDRGVGKYSLIGQGVWGVPPSTNPYRPCTIDNAVMDVEIDVSTPPFQSQPPISSTNSANTARFISRPSKLNSDRRTEPNKSKTRPIPEPKDQAAIEMAVWTLPPSSAEEQFPWHIIQAYFTHSSVVALCYHVSQTETLDNTMNKWHPLIRYHLPAVPIVLVGCQNDQLQSAVQTGASESLVSNGESIRRLQKVIKAIGAIEHLQCSAKDTSSTKVVFDTLAWFGYHHTRQHPEYFKPLQRPKRACVIG